MLIWPTAPAGSRVFPQQRNANCINTNMPSVDIWLWDITHEKTRISARMFRKETFKENLWNRGKGRTWNSIGCSKGQILQKQLQKVYSDWLAMLWHCTKTTKPCGQRKVARPKTRFLDNTEQALRTIGVRRWWRRAMDGYDWRNVLNEAMAHWGLWHHNDDEDMI